MLIYILIDTLNQGQTLSWYGAGPGWSTNRFNKR